MSLANEKTLWAYFKANSKMTEIGIAALLGNFEAESNIESCRLQGDFSTQRINSQKYAEQFDNDTKTALELSKDSKGWGLAQWTYNTRKLKLFNYCKEKGKSCGDLEAQATFCVQELTEDYPGVYSVLKAATSLQTASDYVLRYYENPANQSDSVKQLRASYGQKIYDRNHIEDTAAAADPEEATPAEETSADKKQKILDTIANLKTLVEDL